MILQSPLTSPLDKSIFPLIILKPVIVPNCPFTQKFSIDFFVVTGISLKQNSALKSKTALPFLAPIVPLIVLPEK